MNEYAANVISAAAPPPPPAALDRSQYMVFSRLEINQILHSIMRRAALITAASGGNDFFLTSIIAIDDEDDYLLLECGRQDENNVHALKKQSLSCSTTLDKVQIQFGCEHIEAVIHGGHNAFKIPLPKEMLRLQRREAYRMATPILTPVKCTIVASSKEAPATVQLNLLDISCGGVAILTPPEIFTPEIGAQYSCNLHLPIGRGLQTRIQARNAFMLTLANGKVAQRSGFAFVGLPESNLVTVQRYIMELERQRRSRS